MGQRDEAESRHRPYQLELYFLKCILSSRLSKRYDRQTPPNAELSHYANADFGGALVVVAAECVAEWSEFVNIFL